MKTLIAISVLALVFSMLCIWAIDSYFRTPVVYWSTSRNECVRIVGSETLPEKYIKIWVK